VFQEAVHTELERALGKLSPRERDVLRLRYGLDGHDPRTLEEVGAALHMTRERARQLEGMALEKLRSKKIGRWLRETLTPA
jgi:RNA polymerase primary sigma factor